MATHIAAVVELHLAVAHQRITKALPGAQQARFCGRKAQVVLLRKIGHGVILKITGIENRPIFRQ